MRDRDVRWPVATPLWGLRMPLIVGLVAATAYVAAYLVGYWIWYGYRPHSFQVMTATITCVWPGLIAGWWAWRRRRRDLTDRVHGASTR